MRTPLLATSLLLLPLTLAAQGLAPQVSLQTYHNPDLGLSIRYLASLDKESATSAPKFGENAVFAYHPDADAAHNGSDPCTPMLLALSSGLDTPIDPKLKYKPEDKTVRAPRGTITLSEVKQSCLPKTEEGKAPLDDAILTSLIGPTAKIPGMHPLAPLSNTLLQGSTVWWAASAGYARDAAGKRPVSADLTLVATAGSVVHGHILVWSVSANDPATFNRLLDMAVCFDAPTCTQGYGHLIALSLNTPNKNQTASR